MHEKSYSDMLTLTFIVQINPLNRTFSMKEQKIVQIVSGQCYLWCGDRFKDE
jgi:hypothetical protein